MVVAILQPWLLFAGGKVSIGSRLNAIATRHNRTWSLVAQSLDTYHVRRATGAA